MRDITWTQQGPALWTGRLDDRPAGTIELGSRYTYVDLDGERSPGFRALEDAQAAAASGTVPACPVVTTLRYVLPLLVLAVCVVVAVAVVLVDRA